MKRKDKDVGALWAEVKRLTLEMGRLQQQYDEQTACVIVHRGSALACSDAMRTAYYDERRRAERLAQVPRRSGAPLLPHGRRHAQRTGEQIMNTEQERADFEAWYRLHHGSRDVYGRDASGEYADKQVQGAFNVWQARAALTAQPAASAEPRPDDWTYFHDWLLKEAPLSHEVTHAAMARHAWQAGVRFADLFPLAAPVAAQAPVADGGAA